MDILFLILSLFIPRITLIIYWFINQIPYNTVPFVGDILLAIFLPRVLILIYIAQNPALGVQSPWFWIHLVVAIFVYFFGGKKYRESR